MGAARHCSLCMVHRCLASHGIGYSKAYRVLSACGCICRAANGFKDDARRRRFCYVSGREFLVSTAMNIEEQAWILTIRCSRLRALPRYLSIQSMRVALRRIDRRAVRGAVAAFVEAGSTRGAPVGTGRSHDLGTLQKSLEEGRMNITILAMHWEGHTSIGRLGSKCRSE
jgi:hypothetical protein